MSEVAKVYRLPSNAIGSPECYIMNEQIGKGGFAIVRRALRKHDTATVAIKTILKNMDYGLKEVAAMKEFTTPENESRFVPLLDNFRDAQGNLNLVMPYYPLGSLRDYIKKRGSVSNRQAVGILNQLVNALVYLHSRQFVHRDVTTGNIIIKAVKDDKIIVLLADMGLTRRMDPLQITKATYVGTPGFMAPAVMQKTGYNNNVDIYSLGAVLYSMLVGRDPPAPPTGEPPTREMAEAMVSQVRNINNEAADLVGRMLAKNPIPLIDILSHSFMLSHDLREDNISSIMKSNVPSKIRSKSRDCTHRIVEHGRCTRCSTQVMDRGDRENVPPMYYPAPNHVKSLPLPPAPQPGYDIIWPLPRYDFLAPYTFASPERGRFLFLPDAVVFEHVEKSAASNSMIVKSILSINCLPGGIQKVTYAFPMEMNKVMPEESDPPLRMGHICGTYYEPSLMPPDVRNLYKTVQKSVGIVKGRVAQFTYFYPFNVKDVQAKLMYNGDYRVIFPNSRIFVQHFKGGRISGTLAAQGQSMTREESEFFNRCIALLADEHAIKEKHLGPNYLPQLAAGTKGRDFFVVENQIADEFSHATLATTRSHSRRARSAVPRAR